LLSLLVYINTEEKISQFVCRFAEFSANELSTNFQFYLNISPSQQRIIHYNVKHIMYIAF